MPCNTSPMESLAAFLIAFTCGVISVFAMTAYTDKIRREAQNANQAR